jgi:predicted nuclease of restriction endonuclease-like RecB superfamily
LYQHIKAGVRPHIHPTARFRSSWECNYAAYLNTLVESGVIREWAHEPETFWFDGIKRGTVSYLPDFRITRPDGTIYFAEIKGRWDQKSRTKIRRMAKYHPTVELLIVDTKAYKALEKEVSASIPGWEHPAKKPPKTKRA